jgi:hypothetical protein
MAVFCKSHDCMHVCTPWQEPSRRPECFGDCMAEFLASLPLLRAPLRHLSLQCGIRTPITGVLQGCAAPALWMICIAPASRPFAHELLLSAVISMLLMVHAST